MAQAQSSINEPAQNFFAQLVDGYQQAANRSGGALQFNYQIGGKQIRICYASKECGQIFAPALQHQRSSALSADCQEPDFTIWVWDSSSTGVPTLRVPWTLGDYLPNHLVRGYCDERFRTIAYYAVGEFLPTFSPYLDRYTVIFSGIGPRTHERCPGG